MKLAFCGHRFIILKMKGIISINFLADKMDENKNDGKHAKSFNSRKPFCCKHNHDMLNF